MYFLPPLSASLYPLLCPLLPAPLPSPSPLPLLTLLCPLLPPLSSAPSRSAGYNPPLPSFCLPLALRCPLLPPPLASLSPPLPSPLYFSLHFLPFLSPPLSLLLPFNSFLHFFVAVLSFSSAVCAFPATNVEFSPPPLRDKLVASPIPLHFHLPILSLAPYPLSSTPRNSLLKKKSQKKLQKICRNKKNLVPLHRV